MSRFSDLVDRGRASIETLAAPEDYDPEPQTTDDDGDLDSDSTRRRSITAQTFRRTRSAVRGFESLLDSNVGSSEAAATGHVVAYDPPQERYERYRDLYETTPILKAPIDQMADDITAEGRRAEADSEEAREYAEDWLAQAAIIGKQSGKDVIELIEQLSKGLDVPAKVYIEKVPDEQTGELAALRLVDPGTITEYCRPGGPVLLGPNDVRYEGVKLTSDAGPADGGQAAAFVQYDSDADHTWTDDDGRELAENRLTRDRLIKLVLDPEVGSGEGTSPVGVAEARVRAAKQKLRNKELAIETRAWGQWFVGADPTVISTDQGEEIIWPPEDAEAELAEQMQGMEPGDVFTHEGKLTIQNLPGEVPDILDDLQFDVDYVLSAMPAPKYTVGWEKSINQFVTNGQDERHENRVGSRKGKIERGLTPVVEQVVEEGGYSSKGAGFALSPEPEDALLMSLEPEQIEGMKTLAESFKLLSGGDPTTLLTDEAIAEHIAQVPEDAFRDEDRAAQALDESDPEVMEQFRRSQDAQADASENTPPESDEDGEGDGSG
jgi:hypothetical protein